MTDSELNLNLNQLKGFSGGDWFPDFEILSAEKVVDYWIEGALGETAKNLTKSKRRIDENDEAGSDTGTTVSDDCQPDWRRYI